MTDYTFIVATPDIDGNEHCGTRHEAIGEKAILDAIHGYDCEIRVRERYATDPV
jgi:hypothetical protein